ncbi:MAG: TatD family hydrolase [Planctomycetota bacterium]
MDYIDPHLHMVSRITDDYATLARMGCVAISEPAFWAGYDRGSVDGFRDYFRQLTEVEPRRAAQFGIQHFTWLCINAKEAEDVQLSRDVIAMIPEFLESPGVLGIGEIGLNKNTRNEATVFLEHVDLAMQHDELILIHTPHLEDKYQGTRMILDMLTADSRIDPARVLVDHVEEHTIGEVLDRGFWAGMTLYPVTKCTPSRSADMIAKYGGERLLANSAGDWGPSKPTAVPDLIFEMRHRGYDEALIRKVVYDNPIEFFSKCRRFSMQTRDGRKLGPQVPAAGG